MASILLVDGHSVIFGWDDLRAHHARNPRAAREALAALLTRYQDASGRRVVLVFDGRGPRTAAPEEATAIQIFYSKAGQTADTVIERLVAKYAPIHDLAVATDDNMERQTVTTFGASWVSTAGLRLEMESAEGELQDRIGELRRKRSPSPSRSAGPSGPP